MVTERSLKTGGGEYDYSSRVTEFSIPITGSQRSQLASEEVQQEYMHRKKLDELDEELGPQDWDNFVKELKTTFSDKSKAADAEWKIETFKQGKRNTANFIIEFEALAMKTDTDELHAIFLLKKNVRHDIIKMILEYPPIAMPETLKE